MASPAPDFEPALAAAPRPVSERSPALDSPTAFRTAKDDADWAVVYARWAARDWPTTADLLIAVLELDSEAHEKADDGRPVQPPATRAEGGTAPGRVSHGRRRPRTRPLE